MNSVPMGLRVDPKVGSNVLGGSQSYATAEEFASPQVLAMNWWASASYTANFSMGGFTVVSRQSVSVTLTSCIAPLKTFWHKPIAV